MPGSVLVHVVLTRAALAAAAAAETEQCLDGCVSVYGPF